MEQEELLQILEKKKLFFTYDLPFIIVLGSLFFLIFNLLIAGLICASSSGYPKLGNLDTAICYDTLFPLLGGISSFILIAIILLFFSLYFSKYYHKKFLVLDIPKKNFNFKLVIGTLIWLFLILPILFLIFVYIIDMLG